MIGYGIDVSVFQAPSVIDACAGQVDFVICRAAYGTAQDKRVADHAARVRAIGAKFGLYTFFRNIQSVADQWDALRRVADLVGYREGDIVPALDIEQDPFPTPGRHVSTSWSDAAEDFVGRMVAEYGEALVYITQAEFTQLGSPSWVLARPLWVAHYTAASKAASPGGVEPTIWQHRVAKFERNGLGGYDKKAPLLDQNRLLRPLPLIDAKPAELTDVDRERIAGLVSLTALESADGAFRKGRRAGDESDADTKPPPPDLNV
jgi:GH25 family lysozyme M1 (1,4-beta-N-acetylmuramidase)